MDTAYIFYNETMYGGHRVYLRSIKYADHRGQVVMTTNKAKATYTESSEACLVIISMLKMTGYRWEIEALY